MRRIDKITGRSDDMLIIRGVNVFPSQIEEQVLKCAALSPHYEIEVYREGNLDCVDIRVELKVSAAGEDIKESTAKELAHHIKSYIGISTRIHVLDAGSINRSEGKAKRVFDRRKD
jgi:phenylacetate-CoA ligase